MKQLNLNLTNYTNWLEERNKSSRTIATYCQVLEQFNHQATIDTQSIRSFLKTNIGKYQPNSLKVFRYAVSSYAKFAKIAVDWEWIKGIIPKVQRRCYDTLTPNDLERLKAARCERDKKTYERNSLIIEFLYNSGLRVSELVDIKHHHWEGKSLRVHGKGNKIRQVLLPDFLIKYLKPSSEAYLFTNLNGQPISPLVIRQIIQQRVKKAGLNKIITPHSFRRSFATHLHIKGAKLVTIQHLLGHESITTTEKYIQTDFASLYADYSRLWN